MKAAAVVGAVFLLLLGWTQRERVLAARNDFSQLYAAATLVGSGNLYNEEAYVQVFERTVGVTMEGVVCSSRLPFYAVFLKPLTLFPYRTAFAIFLVVNLLAGIGFVRFFHRLAPELPLFAAFSIPFMAAILNGQDTALLLAIAGGGLLLFQAAREREAGFLWSLLVIKFHLFLPIPILLLVYRQWRVITGGLIGLTLLLAISFLAEPQWVGQYATLLLSSRLDPCIACMPNLRGMANGSRWLEIGATLLTLGLLGGVFYFKPRFEIAMGASIVAGLLLSQHAYIQDATILLLPFALLTGLTTFKPLRALMALAVTPPFYLLLLMKAPYSAMVAIVLIAVLMAATYLSTQNSSASERRT